MELEKAVQRSVKDLFQELEEMTGDVSSVTLKGNAMWIGDNLIEYIFNRYSMKRQESFVQNNDAQLYSAGLKFKNEIEKLFKEEISSISMRRDDNRYMVNIYLDEDIYNVKLPQSIREQIREICADSDKRNNGNTKAALSEIIFSRDGKATAEIVFLYACPKEENIKSPVGINVSEYLNNPSYKDTHELSFTADELSYDLRIEDDETADFFNKYIGDCEDIFFEMHIMPNAETILSKTLTKRFVSFF